MMKFQLTLFVLLFCLSVTITQAAPPRPVGDKPKRRTSPAKNRQFSKS